MAKRTDWLIDDDGDELLGDNGEYLEGDSNLQEAWEAIETVKGEVAQFPTAGFGAKKRLRKRNGAGGIGETPQRFARDMKIELESDGQEDPDIFVASVIEAINFNTNVE